jgi:hypothetical protein
MIRLLMGGGILVGGGLGLRVGRVHIDDGRAGSWHEECKGGLFRKGWATAALKKERKKEAPQQDGSRVEGKEGRSGKLERRMWVER